jgi:hypothetical protein
MQTAVHAWNAETSDNQGVYEIYPDSDADHGSEKIYHDQSEKTENRIENELKEHSDGRGEYFKDQHHQQKDSGYDPRHDIPARINHPLKRENPRLVIKSLSGATDPAPLSAAERARPL